MPRGKPRLPRPPLVRTLALSHPRATLDLMTSPTRLSKSRFTSGLQCHKKLWWEVHEPDAKELQPDKVLQDLFDQGRLVGEAARQRYPGGVLIDLPHNAGAERVAATQKALDAGPLAIFEATFIAENTFEDRRDRKSTRLNSSHLGISYAVFCLKKKKKTHRSTRY